MTSTLVYPKPIINVIISDVATETTLAAVLAKLSLDVILSPFYEATNSIGNTSTPIGTVPVGKTLQKISVKCNDGCTFIIDVGGSDKIETIPSGEVQMYDLVAPAGSVIGIRQVGTPSNAGPLTINFFG